MPDWDTFFNMLYGSRGTTDVASSALKAVNVLGEAGVPGAKGLMDYVDERAYQLGSQGSSPARYTANPPKEVGEDPYTGIYAPQGSVVLQNLQEGPNLLKIFLGMEENILPESEYRPTSWTKGDPEQGWRSIKDFSELEVQKPGRGDMSLTSGYHKELIDNLQGVNLMREAVASGEYTPEMAVKSKKFPGLRYDTAVNVGHMTKSVGYDPEKEQYYFSMSDVWDFEPEQYSEIWGGMTKGGSERAYTQAALMQASGKSIGLYDRYYLPENYMTDWFGELDIEDRIVGDMKRMDKGFLGE